MPKEIIPQAILESKILLVRKHKVLLDRDLAGLYQVETRVLNQAVRRNLERFPDDFILKLTRDEIRDLSQFVISPGLKHAPSVFAFTEQGVAMLSGVLHSKRAIAVNIAIMRTFVKLRGLLAEHADLRRKLEEMEKKYDYQFKVVFDAIKSLIADPPPVKKIGFMAKR